MKFIIVFVALFTIVAAKAVSVSDESGIVRQESEVLPDSFRYAYATSDGAQAEAEGQLKNIGSEDEAIVVKGSYSYVANDGQTYSINYVADENGYQPQGAHLPVVPVAYL